MQGTRTLTSVCSESRPGRCNAQNDQPSLETFANNCINGDTHKELYTETARPLRHQCMASMATIEAPSEAKNPIGTESDRPHASPEYGEVIIATTAERLPLLSIKRPFHPLSSNV